VDGSGLAISDIVNEVVLNIGSRSTHSLIGKEGSAVVYRAGAAVKRH
jgi:hypothetical protein